MTSQIADALMNVLDPTGVIVVIEAEHLCMAMRGVRKPGAKTVTSAVRGIFRDSTVTRAEAMSLIVGRPGADAGPRRIGHGPLAGQPATIAWALPGLPAAHSADDYADPP